MLQKLFFSNLANELNIHCTRKTNYDRHEKGASWSSNDFKIHDLKNDKFYYLHSGCSDHWGGSCCSCEKILKQAKNDFKNLVVNIPENKLKILIEKVESLEDKMNQILNILNTMSQK